MHISSINGVQSFNGLKIKSLKKKNFILAATMALTAIGVSCNKERNCHQIYQQDFDTAIITNDSVPTHNSQHYSYSDTVICD